MTQSEILEELYKLPLAERLAIVDAVLREVRADAAHLEEPTARPTREQLLTAVELMRRDYESDPELTALTVLDSEDFVA